MTITYVIPGARTLDQLNEPTLDGKTDEDARENCVAASVAEGLSILTSKTFVGDELHDAVYGQGYIGPQAAMKYVPYCDAQGVALQLFTGTQQQLIATIRHDVAAGHPVVVTMPSNWATAPTDPVHPSGSTHVGLAVGIGPDTIRVMNPWHGFMQDATDEWWQARLCYGQVWVMQRKAASVTTPTATTPAQWSDDGETLTAPNKHTVTQGFRDHIRTYVGGWPSWDWPLTEAVGRDPVELGSPASGGGTYQIFRSTMLAWTKARGVYEVWVGQELEAIAAQVANANAAAAALKQQLTQAEAKNASMSELPAAETAALKADIAGLKSAADALSELTTLGTPTN